MVHQVIGKIYSRGVLVSGNICSKKSRKFIPWTLPKPKILVLYLMFILIQKSEVTLWEMLVWRQLLEFGDKKYTNT